MRRRVAQGRSRWAQRSRRRQRESWGRSWATASSQPTSSWSMIPPGAGQRESWLLDAGQGILEDLGGNLHRADLAPAGAGPLRQQAEPPPGRLAHRHLGMTHPARLAGPTGSFSLPRHEPALQVFQGPGQPRGTEGTPTDVGDLTDHLGVQGLGDPLDVPGQVTYPPRFLPL